MSSHLDACFVCRHKYRVQESEEDIESLEVVFNGDSIAAKFENTDDLTHRWTLDRAMYVIVLESENRVLTPTNPDAVTCFRTPMTDSLFE